MAGRMSGGTVAKAAGLYVFGNVTQKGAFFATLPIYARMLDVDGYARWSLFLGLSAALSIAFDLAWSRAIPRLYYEYVGDPAGGDAYLFVSFLQRVCLLLASILLFVGVAPIVIRAASAGRLSSPAFAAPLLAVCVSEAVVLFVCAAYRARQQPLPFVSLKIGQAVMQLGVSFAMIVMAGLTPECAARGFALGSVFAAAAAIVLFLSWARGMHRPSRAPFGATFRANMRFSLPLVFHDYASWLRNAADPFIIVQFLPLYSVSIYHIGYQFGLVIGLILYSVELALSPFYFELMKKDRQFEEKYMAITQAVIVCTFALAVTLELFAREIIAVIFPIEVREAARIAPLIVVGYFLLGLYSVYIKPFILLARTAVVPVITLGPTLLGIAGSVALIPVLGVMGPAVSTIASLALLAGVSIAAAQRVMPLPYPFRLHCLLTMVVAIAGVASSSAWQATSGEVLIVKGGVWLSLMGATCLMLARDRGRVVRLMTNRSL